MAVRNEQLLMGKCPLEPFAVCRKGSKLLVVSVSASHINRTKPYRKTTSIRVQTTLQEDDLTGGFFILYG